MVNIALCILLYLMTISAVAAQDKVTSAKAATPPRDSANIFISGHSLTDNPFGNYIEAIAKSRGQAIRWNQQINIGSPIRARTHGPSRTRWPAEAHGSNKLGQPSGDIRKEFRTGALIGGARYDTLIITERHDLLNVLLWEDTVRELRDYHETLIESSPAGQTYFYESWLQVRDTSNPKSWTAYERASSKIWQCVATRINSALEAEGRPDRILNLPAGLALVELVEHAIAAKIPGLTGANTKALLNRIFSDDVHMTQLGHYYLAAVSYSAIYRRSPVGAWAPSNIDGALAAGLQELAWKTISNYYANYSPLTLPQCRALMQESYCDEWARYMQPVQGCKQFFMRLQIGSGPSDTNPLYFDPASDKSFWLARPPTR
jgi:hypothetical protein